MTKIPCNKEEKRILSAWNFFEKKLDKKTLIAELKEKYPSLDDSVAYLDALKAYLEIKFYFVRLYMSP